MRLLKYTKRVSLMAVLAMSATGAVFTATAAAQEIATEGPVPTSALIRVDSKNEQPLDPAMLRLEVNGHQTPIQSVTPILPSQAQVAILIDDGLRMSFSLQEKELEDFVRKLPSGMRVMIGFMRNGQVMSHGFTTDHEAALQDLRIPIGMQGVSGSPYFTLSDFVKQWPSNAPGPRFVLMITNGVDPYNGSVSPLNQDSPYVQTAQEDAQRAGVAVYSIYYPIHAERGNLVSFSGQSYLQQVGAATGGESLYMGNMTPVDLKPFFDHFAKDLAESYVMRFQASAAREKSRTLSSIKVKSEQPGVKVHAPDAVHPGV